MRYKLFVYDETFNVIYFYVCIFVYMYVVGIKRHVDYELHFDGYGLKLNSLTRILLCTCSAKFSQYATKYVVCSFWYNTSRQTPRRNESILCMSCKEL